MQMIVLGMHRSGTSMITRLINMMGAYFAPEKASLGFGPDNPKGFWERKDALALNNTLLKLNGCTWDRLAEWPLDARNAADAPTLRAMQMLILEMDAHRPWVLKDPRLCLTFEYWRPMLEVPVCVIAHRSPLESAMSLLKRNNIPLDYGLALWEYHAVHLLNSSLGLPCVHVQQKDAVENPVRFTETLLERLEAESVRGLRMPSAREITAFIDPSLHREKQAELPQIRLSPHQLMLIELLTGEAIMHEELSVSDASIERMQEGY